MKHKTFLNFLLYAIFIYLTGSLCNKIRDRNMCRKEICADCNKEELKPCSDSSTERSNPNHRVISYYVNCLACRLNRERDRENKQQEKKNNKENALGRSR